MSDTVMYDSINETDVVVAKVKSRLSALSLFEDTVAKAKTFMEANGVSEKHFDRLRREWVNETIILPDEDFEIVIETSVQENFLEWIRDRVLDPLAVRNSTFLKAVDRYGALIAMLFKERRWEQEISWAKRMRRSDDPTISVLSALFVTEALRNPADTFLALVDAYMNDNSITAQTLTSSAHEMSPSDIRNFDGFDFPHGFSPLYIKYASAKYGETVAKMPVERLRAMAAQAAMEERRDFTQKQKELALDFLTKWPLTHRMTTLHMALEANLSSNELVSAYEEFKLAIMNDHISPPESDQFIDSRFFQWIRSADFPLPEAITGEEKKRILEEITMLNKSWVRKIPTDFSDRGATSRELIHAWRKAILTGFREPPRDLIVDYCLYFLENKLSQTY